MARKAQSKEASTQAAHKAGGGSAEENSGKPEGVMKSAGYAIIALVGIAALAIIVWIAVSSLNPGGGISTPTPAPTSTPAITPTPPITETKGPASDRLDFVSVEREDAPAALLNGSVDYYLTPLTPEQGELLKNDSRINLTLAPSQLNDLLFNPAPSTATQINPFSSKKFRFAMQYLIDRQGIARDAQKGYGIPIYTSVYPGHPSYGVTEPVVAQFNISYDPAKAEALINDAMVSLGARKIAGKWTYGNRQVRLAALSTERIAEFGQIISQLARELESQGFDVQISNVPADGESPMYSTDPASLEWNFGFTGAIFYGASRYQEAFFYPPPEGENWTYNNSRMEGFEAMLANYSSQAEWEQANRLVTSEGLNESVCIWVTASQSIFASRSDVRGLTYDKFIGLRTLGNAREAYSPGKAVLTVGREYTRLAEESWNALVVEGIYAMDVANTLQDPPTWSTPEDLSTRPFRWGYAIETAGPTGNMTVPADAVTWDSSAQRWSAVGAEAKARSKVSYNLSNFIGSKWHDGSNITWGDILYFTASAWDLSKNPDKDDYSSGDTRFDLIKGIRINGRVLEVYTDSWGFYDEAFLSFSGLYSRLAPWNEYAAIDALVYGDKEFVYYEYYAPRNNTAPALSLLNSTHALAVLQKMDSLDYARVAPYMTVGSIAYGSDSELASRAASARSWFNSHGNLEISSGPFYLDSYDSGANTFHLKAFRDPSYPFSKGHWLPGGR
ncbi:Bacterial extracellular solute-binding proteins, family 5 Middle [uncultured archaeon]|nr:Bacterial extracellular solute-binding proteins, family 5 Middle [uncultured archaeon]